MREASPDGSESLSQDGPASAVYQRVETRSARVTVGRVARVKIRIFQQKGAFANFVVALFECKFSNFIDFSGN
jgi:hypothetical protein